jgi:hypothetical protein
MTVILQYPQFDLNYLGGGFIILEPRKFQTKDLSDKTGLDFIVTLPAIDVKFI